jgi:hypothetical protein
VGYEGLADDPDALADLGSSPCGQGLVQDVLVDALALLAPVLLRPGHAQPALLAELSHQGPALRGVDDLGHVLASGVEHVGVVVGVQERLDLDGEGLLVG